MPEEKMSYSKALERLQEIVRLLEKDLIPIDDLEPIIYESRKLLSYCNGKLHNLSQILNEEE